MLKRSRGSIGDLTDMAKSHTASQCAPAYWVVGICVSDKQRFQGLGYFDEKEKGHTNMPISHVPSSIKAARPG